MKELLINIITMAVLAVSLGYLWAVALTTIN
jgi:hypothetical protein